MQSRRRRASQERWHPRLGADVTFHANLVLFMTGWGGKREQNETCFHMQAFMISL